MEMDQLEFAFISIEANDLLPEMRSPSVSSPVSIAVTYPPVKSVYGRILGVFLNGHRLTCRDVQYRFSASRLAADVHKLRAMGWPIQKMTIAVVTRDQGRISYAAQYWLNPADIALAGERGRLYIIATIGVFHGQKAA